MTDVLTGMLTAEEIAKRGSPGFWGREWKIDFNALSSYGAYKDWLYQFVVPRLAAEGQFPGLDLEKPYTLYYQDGTYYVRQEDNA